MRQLAPAVEARKRIADAIAAKQRRLDIALILQRRGETGLTEAGEKPLYEAARCHSRALHHHRAVVKHHDAAVDSIHELATVHRKLTATLERLGEVSPTVKRHLDDIHDHLSGARASVESAADHQTNLGAAVDRAARCVRSVLTTGLEESAPEDDVETGEQDDFEDRAAHARHHDLVRKGLA